MNVLARDDRWNPWVGCTKVSPGCRDCYMFREQRQHGHDPSVVRRTVEATWNLPHKWQRQCERDGSTRLIFVCSWSDFFHVAADPWRAEAWRIIRSCPNVIFQILTKRPENIVTRLPADWGTGYANVWLGVSIESNEFAERADILRGIPAPVRFIMGEPLIGPMDRVNLDGMDWLILGGESGARETARTCDLTWMMDVVRRRPEGLAVCVKQLGTRYRLNDQEYVGRDLEKHDNWSDYPDELRLWEWPKEREMAAHAALERFQSEQPMMIDFG